jgi:ribosomal protein S18 acetylase RimI-like enzyme
MAALDGLRSYQPQDLDRVLQFVGDCCAACDFCGCFHPGDVLHFMSNTLRGRDLSQYLYLYEAEDVIQAIIMINPARFAAFNLMIAPSIRTADLEHTLIQWAEASEQALMQAAGISKPISSDVMDCDGALQNAMRASDYSPEAAPYILLTERSLETAIPDSVLPPGFTIRSVAGEQEAAWVIEAHVSAFNSNWTADEYVHVMRTPGFDIDREVVVVAPDGRCAAFLIYWLDPTTRAGLFEPVGCHVDFQRQGLTRALMYEGMRRMKARGMTRAIVNHLADNPVSTGFYRSLGFAPKYAITDFRKAMAS